MKIVRFRARTLLAAAAVSAVCLVLLIRTSNFLIDSDNNNNNNKNNNNENEQMRNVASGNDDLHLRKIPQEIMDKTLIRDQDRRLDMLKKNSGRKDVGSKIESRNKDNFYDKTGDAKVSGDNEQQQDSNNKKAFEFVEQKDGQIQSVGKSVDENNLAANFPVTSNSMKINENLVPNENYKNPMLPKQFDFDSNNNNLEVKNNQQQEKSFHHFAPSNVFVPNYLRPNAANDPAAAPKYPILTPDNKFIPSRRIVHLDLKGAAPKVDYFEKFFDLIANLGATGILIEYEDMFPYTGVLAPFRAGNAYSDADVRQILTWAAKYNLEVIPLIQTFGHLEWLLKHEKFAKYREVNRYAQVICLSNMDAVELVKNALDQVMQFHKDTSEFVHIGADEAFQVGMCNKCQDTIRLLQNSRDRLMIRHIANISLHVQKKYKKRVLMWHDMLVKMDDMQVIREYGMDKLVEPVIWAYAESLNDYLTPDTWYRFSSTFPYIWGASAFKGADGPSRYYSNVPHYLKNHISWNEQMSREYKHFKEFRGLILTGWQRFDHFAILCELLPVALHRFSIAGRTANIVVVQKNAPKSRSKTSGLWGTLINMWVTLIALQFIYIIVRSK
uniref:beta-N-acetylhexosaminidase n=1 Tax=Romanomermis culicivorax TaxID=13658 RepID=A0A915HN12_ROMCU